MKPLDSLPDPSDFLQANEVAAEPPAPKRYEAPDRRNHMSLVQFRHVLQTSNVPRGSWEPLSYLYGEWVQDRFRYTQSDKRYAVFLQEHAPYLLQEISDPNEENFRPVLNWISPLFVMGQSVDGWAGNNMANAIKAGKEPEAIQAGGKVAANEDGKTESTRRGLRGIFG